MTSNEKEIHYQSSSALASGVKHEGAYDDVEHSRKGSRKPSVIASIKNNYGLVEQPGSSDDDRSSLKRGQDFTHRKLRARHIQLIGIGKNSDLFPGPVLIIYRWYDWYCSLCSNWSWCSQWWSRVLVPSFHTLVSSAQPTEAYLTVQRCSVIMMVTNGKFHSHECCLFNVL